MAAFLVCISAIPIMFTCTLKCVVAEKPLRKVATNHGTFAMSWDCKWRLGRLSNY